MNTREPILRSNEVSQSPLFLSRVDHDAPLVLEDWTLRVSNVSADGKTWEFDVRGSVTGQDGSGRSDQPFVSQSRRVKIDPAAWFRGFFPPLPDAYTIRWQVLPMFVDAFRMPQLDDPTKENSTTVVQGIINGKHTLEIIAVWSVVRRSKWLDVVPFRVP